MESLIDSYIENSSLDYLSYTIDGSKCCIKSHIGIFTEIVSLNALEQVVKNKRIKKHFFENVTEYIYEHSDKFLVNLIKEDFNSSIINDIRLTLDTQEDMYILKNIYEKLNIKNDIDFYEILNYLHENKDILDIMRNIINKNMK
jgi:spore coat polysaccharide biosynthesis protein SpsF (cytidylyltransferase family)